MAKAMRSIVQILFLCNLLDLKGARQDTYSNASTLAALGAGKPPVSTNASMAVYILCSQSGLLAECDYLDYKAMMPRKLKPLVLCNTGRILNVGRDRITSCKQELLLACETSVDIPLKLYFYIFYCIC